MTNKEITLDSLPHTEWERLIYSLTFRWIDSGVPIEDIRQEAWLLLLHAANTYNPTKGTKFSTWASVYIITYTKRFVQSWLKKHRHLPLNPEIVEERHSSETPLTIVSRHDTIDYVMGLLSEEDATLLDMRYIQDKTFAEIGDVFGVTPQRIEQKLRKAEERIERIKKHESNYCNGM